MTEFSLAAVVDAIEAELDGMARQRLQNAFAEMRSTPLQPETAHSVLMELFAHHELARRLRQKAKGGTL